MRLLSPTLYVPHLRYSSLTRLDSIGIGGFSHDFGSLEGNSSPILAAFDSLGSVKPSFSVMLSVVLGVVCPGLAWRIPNERTKSLISVATSTRGMATELLDRTAKEKANGGASEVDKSILGALGEYLSFLDSTICSG